MKDYAWKLAERYPNHEKHMSLRDGVEMEVEGHGDRWAWNIHTTTGAYIAKGGFGVESLREAKQKAEGAADGARALVKHAKRKPLSDERIWEILTTLEKYSTAAKMAKYLKETNLEVEDLRELFTVILPRDRLRKTISRENAAESVALAFYGGQKVGR